MWTVGVGGGGTSSDSGITGFIPDYAPLAQTMKDAQERARKTVDPATLDPRRIPAIREALIARFNAQMSGADRRKSETDPEPQEGEEKETVRGTSLFRIAQRRGLLSAIVNGEEVLYRDVDIFAWYAPYISLLIEENVAQGYKDEDGKPTGEFGVGKPVTYAEILKMALEAAHLRPHRADSGGQAKTDLTGSGSPRNRTAVNTWASAYVAAGESKGLSLYGPAMNVHAPASRGEVIQTILEVMGVPEGIRPGEYRDVPADHPHARAIGMATFLGIAQGDTDAEGNSLGTFRPDEPINRAEAAKIIALIQELLRR